MAKMTRKMTSTEFADLMCSIENGDYRCNGFSHNCDHTPENWDGISLERISGSPMYAHDFHVAHPLSKDKSRIDYNALEVRFRSKYPFEKEESYTIDNSEWVRQFKEASQEPLEAYRA